MFEPKVGIKGRSMRAGQNPAKFVERLDNPVARVTVALLTHIPYLEDTMPNRLRYSRLASKVSTETQKNPSTCWSLTTAAVQRRSTTSGRFTQPIESNS